MSFCPQRQPTVEMYAWINQICLATFVQLISFMMSEKLKMSCVESNRFVIPDNVMSPNFSQTPSYTWATQPLTDYT